jgi:hypothetical protein
MQERPVPLSSPQLKLRIITDKDIYTLNERVMARVEFTNLMTKTLCFPIPNSDCESSETGSAVTTGESVKTGRDQFICHLDGGGVGRPELESAIENHWIKLPPNAVYLTKAAEAKVTLSEVGDWRLSASYHPPEPAFNRDYKKVMESAAEEAGCTLPDSSVIAQPRTISVLPPAAKDR